MLIRGEGAKKDKKYANVIYEWSPSHQQGQAKRQQRLQRQKEIDTFYRRYGIYWLLTFKFEHIKLLRFVSFIYKQLF